MCTAIQSGPSSFVLFRASLQSLILSAFVCTLHAQVVNGGSDSYTIIDRGQNHRTIQRTYIETNPTTGRRTLRTGHYVELANGLHYWDEASKQWSESKDLIEQFSQGAVARQGPTKVIFSRNANTVGAIDLVTAGGKRLRSHVLGIYYFDAVTGKSVQVAEVKNSIGQLFPPNQLVYPDAFEGGGIKGDLHYIYTKGAFEQNIILLGSGTV